MGDKKIFRFEGEKLDVEWDGRLCIHIAECGQAKGDLFVAGRQPWCKPDLVADQEVAEVVERCPTGALTYHAKAGDKKEQHDSENSVMVSYNGPYFIRGNLDIEGRAGDMPGVTYRAALCRCGESKNKPFCDNSHENSQFKDYGAVGEKGETLVGQGDKLKVNAMPDGPLLLKGNVRIYSSSGRPAWSGTSVALCRCGASKNKPFCDGSHKEAGFKS